MNIVLRRSTAALALLALALMGCGSTSKLVNVIDATGSVSISVTKSATPTFSWTEDVTVQSISVHRYSSQGTLAQTLWGYANVALIDKVTYGAILNGVNLAATTTAPPLQRGVRYHVTIVSDGAESSADWIGP